MDQDLASTTRLRPRGYATKQLHKNLRGAERPAKFRIDTYKMSTSHYTAVTKQIFACRKPSQTDNVLINLSNKQALMRPRILRLRLKEGAFFIRKWNVGENTPVVHLSHQHA
ncbi:hypothetical protein QD460_04410 [Rhizobium jaguaris]|uniref:hypothetical protein n=1 Tax=Rhizobium jaguaris TaxID=1312183 RepID=UPI0039BF35DB